MRIARCELIALRIPLRRPFVHAGASRSASEPVIVRLVSAAGEEGLGEIQARPYVTGETNREILEESGPELAHRIVGARFESEAELRERVALELDLAGRRLALWGGFEGALRQLWGRRHGLDDELWIGPRRTAPAGSCATIGLVDDAKELRRAAVGAKLRGATVVKVKIGSGDDPGRDRERLERLDGHFRGSMPLRLDANGSLELDRGIRLLRECRSLPIHSLEQPFAADDPDLGRKLRELHSATGVPLAADESVVTFDDARRLAGSEVYQIFNLRVGKMGGVAGTARIGRLAERAGIGVVAGTMVGETGLLDRASQSLLEHGPALGYVEGLGQNRFLLEADPVQLEEGGRVATFRLRTDLPEAWTIARWATESSQ